MKFRDIKPFIGSQGGYEVNIPLTLLEGVIKTYVADGLDLNPDFQRGHVWTKAQQIAFVEFFLRGGTSGRVIFFNCPGWQLHVRPGSYNDFVIVDGLQRLTALLKFVRNELPVFGCLLNEFEDSLRGARAGANLGFNINQLPTKAEVLEWYIEMNSGGTVHSDEEIARVNKMREEELKKEKLTSKP